MELFNNEPLPGYDYWEEHSDFTFEDWRRLVNAKATRQGYWQWVKAVLESEERL